MKIRPPADIVGFPHTERQIETIVRRIGAMLPEEGRSWRLAIVPHDDYHYVGELYPAVLKDITAPTVVIFGVAHKARQFSVENELVFESYVRWSGPYGPIPVSDLREEILADLPPEMYRVDDELQTIEHSIEALLPFLQHYNRDLRIIPILVPAMSFERMEHLALQLGEALAKSMRRRGWKWGTDLALAISNDAVHYGDEEWGGRDFARFGTDPSGYRQAIALEQEIIGETLTGRLSPERIRRFTEYTVRADDFREYLWTWCGRYSVPFGLLAGWHLARALSEPPLDGELVGYGTSVDGREHLMVDDLGMGITAPATMRHWVGYASVGYR